MGFKEEKELKLKKRYENNLKKRRFSTINNNIKEHYRKLNNNIKEQREHEQLMRLELKELITRIEKFKNLTFIGAFDSIPEYNENVDGEYSFDELISTCFDDDEIIFTLAGNITTKQSGELMRKLSIFQCEMYTVKNIEYHRFSFNFNNYFQADLGSEYIEPYMVRKSY